jgi:hypothetical protein
MKRKLFFHVVLVVSLFSLVCLTSCVGWTATSLNNGYKLFTLTKGIGHFSLEYPQDYSIGIVEINNSSENTYIHITFFTNPPKGQEKELAGTFVQILISPPDSNIGDAKSDFEYSLSIAQNEDNYKLLDQFELDIVGSHSYGVDYSFTVVPDLSHSPLGSVTKYCTTREIDFEKDNLLWTISMTSDTTYADRDKAYFDHILQSLKILN